MAKKDKKIRPGGLSSSAGIVASPPKIRKISFSFKYFDHVREKEFALDGPDGLTAQRAIDILDRLRDLADFTALDLISNGSKSFRCHRVSWENTPFKRGFHWIDPEICTNCYQISISTSKGRLQGFFIDDVFYIVWLDLHHKVYPRK